MFQENYLPVINGFSPLIDCGLLLSTIVSFHSLPNPHNIAEAAQQTIGLVVTSCPAGRRNINSTRPYLVDRVIQNLYNRAEASYLWVRIVMECAKVPAGFIDHAQSIIDTTVSSSLLGGDQSHYEPHLKVVHSPQNVLTATGLSTT